MTVAVTVNGVNASCPGGFDKLTLHGDPVYLAPPQACSDAELMKCQVGVSIERSGFPCEGRAGKARDKYSHSDVTRLPLMVRSAAASHHDQ